MFALAPVTRRRPHPHSRGRWLLGVRCSLVWVTLWITIGLAQAQASVPLVPSVHSVPGAHWVPSVNSATQIIDTPLGQIKGYLRHGAIEFRGIPYALPPIGERRWAGAVPAGPWQRLLDANDFKPACAQESRYGITDASNTEDCLYLNVSVPARDGWPAKGAPDSKPLPVIVWIHGGALVGGSSTQYRLDRLATGAQAAVVSVNYRLGVFGFLAHPSLDPDLNGGFGLEDVRLALRWVKHNIAAFGGDPTNVTVMGESAGALLICNLLATPDESAGLFEKAIILSANCLYQLEHLDTGNAIGVEIAKTVGCADPHSALECLRQQDTEVLLKAGQPTGFRPIPLPPVIGTARLPEKARLVFKNSDFVRVPMIIGNTRDELRLYIGYEAQAGHTVTLDNYEASLRRFYGDRAKAVKQAYPPQSYSSAGAALGSAVSSFTPGFSVSQCLSVETAKLAARQTSVYLLDFADRTTEKRGILIPAEPDPGLELGASHSSVLSYLFPGFSSTRETTPGELSAGSQASADALISHLGAFIRHGDPNTKGLPQWPPVGNHTIALRFDNEGIRPIDPDQTYQCEFWRKLYVDEFKKLTQPQ
jgi:para-nitrobenzyl esterase